MITNRVNFVASRIKPNPIFTDYWVDLSEDENGRVVKVKVGDNWVNVLDNNGGTDGTFDYNELINKPKVNGLELIGDISIEGKQGPRGDIGPQGLPGPQGVQGLPGAKGEQGKDGITYIPSVTENGDISWTNDGGAINPKTVNIKGPKGDAGTNGKDGINGKNGKDGKDGTGVNILGSYDTEEELRLQHPTGNQGDSYLIKGDLYVWSINTNDWINAGSIKGPKGDNGKDGINGKDGAIGPRGERGIQGEQGPKGADGKNGLDGAPGQKGEQGIQGEPGKNGIDGLQGPRGLAGLNGKDGTTYTPYVSPDGILSFTNNGNLVNPSPVNIKGPKGDNGNPGANGVNGTSVTHTWKGSILQITSASGTTSSDLKGPKGDKGSDGTPIFDATPVVDAAYNSESVTKEFFDNLHNAITNKNLVYVVKSGEFILASTLIEDHVTFEIIKLRISSKSNGEQITFSVTHDNSRYTASYYSDDINERLFDKQDTLVSGINIKTINHETILGDGNIDITGSGENGATFTPSVDSEGNLSWSNDKNLPNPKTINIKGPKGNNGLDGNTGPRGEKGEPGETGLQGPRGLQGERGIQGEQGVSVTHRWIGTTLQITSASGTSSADLKGPKGDSGSGGGSISNVDSYSGTDSQKINAALQHGKTLIFSDREYNITATHDLDGVTLIGNGATIRNSVNRAFNHSNGILVKDIKFINNTSQILFYDTNSNYGNKSIFENCIMDGGSNSNNNNAFTGPCNSDYIIKECKFNNIDIYFQRSTIIENPDSGSSFQRCYPFLFNLNNCSFNGSKFNFTTDRIRLTFNECFFKTAFDINIRSNNAKPKWNYLTLINNHFTEYDIKGEYVVLDFGNQLFDAINKSSREPYMNITHCILYDWFCGYIPTIDNTNAVCVNTATYKELSNNTLSNSITWKDITVSKNNNYPKISPAYLGSRLTFVARDDIAKPGIADSGKFYYLITSGGSLYDSAGTSPIMGNDVLAPPALDRALIYIIKNPTITSPTHASYNYYYLIGETEPFRDTNRFWYPHWY